MFSHILTSIIGSHSNIQDAIRYFENDDIIIAIVADGLGSRKMSAYGARLICKLMEKELACKRPPLIPTDIVSPQIWLEFLKSKDKNCDDYCTTCSFAFIDKSAKQITVGQIGDSPIFIKVDFNNVIELRQEKDFSNITDSLGGNTVSTFRVQNYHYKDSIKVMVTTDGIGEELESASIDSLFSYLSSTYQQYTPKSRSRRFTKEIKETIGKVNHDDKSAIYIWSI